MQAPNSILRPFAIKACIVSCALCYFGSSTPAASAPAAPERPLTGHCETTYTILSFDGTNLRIQHSGTCRLTLLGAGPIFKDELVNITIVPAPINGAVTITASNGDELHGVETAQVYPPDFNACTEAAVQPGRWEFSGGTGRFANAAGSATWTVTIDPCAQTTKRDVSGTLAFSPTTPGPLEFRYAPRTGH